MAEKLTHQEFDKQVEEAMNPSTAQAGGGFAPGIQKMRQTASKRKPLPARRRLPTAS